MNKETAQNVALCALNKLKESGKYPISYSITCCQTCDEIEVLDLRFQGNAIKTLEKLYAEGIDVLTDSYSKHNGLKFSEIKAQYEEYCRDVKNPYMAKLIQLQDEEKVRAFFRHGRFSIIGQLLTDYGNGIAFKDELIRRDYEGYIFDEEQSSPTVCLFAADKLFLPVHEIIKVESV